MGSLEVMLQSTVYKQGPAHAFALWHVARTLFNVMQDVEEEELSAEELKERKIMKLLLKVKNGTPPQRKSALRQLTDKVGPPPVAAHFMWAEEAPPCRDLLPSPSAMAFVCLTWEVSAARRQGILAQGRCSTRSCRC